MIVAVKSSSMVSDEPDSWSEGIACPEFIGNGESSEGFSDSWLRDAIDGVRAGLPVLRKPLEMAEKDNYQVALIPIPNPPKQSGPEASLLAKMHSVFVLPLTWKDLVTRLRAEGKRSRSNGETDVVDFGAVRVNLFKMEACRAGEPVALTALEFKLLRYFIWNPSKVISRDELLNQVWGFDNYPCTRTVDSHVWRLRKKLEADPANPVHFQTVHSMGYKFIP